MSTRRYRIAHLITRLELGGAQQNTLFSVRHHDRSRYAVSLLAGSGGMLDDEARAVRDASIELWSCLKRPIAPFWDGWTLIRLVRYLRREKIDLLHTHSSKAGVLGRLAGWLAGVPAVVHTVHGWSFNRTQPRVVRAFYVALERLAAAVTSKILVVAEGNRQQGIGLGIGREEQYRVVRSGIDRGRFERPVVPRNEMRERLGFTSEQIVVGGIACLKPQKAPLDFVAAAARACRADERLRFVMVGDGALRGELESKLAEEKLGDRVRLLGWRDDVVDLLHAMDIFLLTSLFEGLPRAVLQSMAAGTPVVATAVDGTPEVVEDGVTGRLVEPGRPEQAARAVLELAGNEELRKQLASRARARVTEEFDIVRMVRELDEIYGELLESSS